MNHKELTAHIRRRVRKAGIKASVRMTGSRVEFPGVVIQPASREPFTDDERYEIGCIAQANGLLTAGRQRPDPEAIRTNSAMYRWSATFYLP